MRTYEQPDVDVVVFECEDVIKTSGGVNVDSGSDFNAGNGYDHNNFWF